MGELTAKKLMELRDKYSKSRIERLVGLREAILSGPEEAERFGRRKNMSVATFHAESRILKEEGVWPLN